MRFIQKLFFALPLIATMGIADATTSTGNDNLSWAKPGDRIDYVKFYTNLGNVEVAVDETAAPKTAKNFLNLVDTGFYNSLIFHRVIPGFMVQGGGFTKDMKERTPPRTIKNEANNGLKNVRGAIAMARTADPDSAGAQFFIDLVDNPSLDYVDNTPGGVGYTVFGRVISGMDVVDSFAKVPTTTRGIYENVPVAPIIIRDVNIVK